MHKPGDVVRFWSPSAGKLKYHLAISLDGKYLFLNSPKARRYAGNLVLPCSDFPFLPPTPENESWVCCTLLITPAVSDIKKMKAEVKGTVDSSVLLKIVDFVEDNEAISDEERDVILDGLGSWL